MNITRIGIFFLFSGFIYKLVCKWGGENWGWRREGGGDAESPLQYSPPAVQLNKTILLKAEENT